MEHMLGRRVLVTRAADDNGPWVERLLSLGAEPVPLPCISIENLTPTDSWLDQLNSATWVAFTSHRAVRLFSELLGDGNLANQLIAAVGPSTRAACMDSFGRCDLSSEHGTGSDLAKRLTTKATQNTTVLLPGAAEPRPELSRELTNAGVLAIPLPLYATRPAKAAVERADMRGALDAALFASPSAVSGCFGSAAISPNLPASCIGPTTADAARNAGLKNVYTSDTRDLDGLLRALREPFATSPYSS